MTGAQVSSQRRWNWQRLAWTLVAAALLSPTLLAAGDLAKVKARGKLRMVCFANQDNGFVRANLDALRESHRKLTDLRDPKDFEGFDVALLRGFADSLGVELEMHSLITGYDDLIPALLHGDGDLIANSLTITKQRSERVDFSDPYLVGWEVVVVRPDSTIAAIGDLRGKKCAVARGSSQVESLRSFAPEAQQVVKDFPLATYVAVAEGEADCTLSENATPIGSTLSPPYPPLKVALRVRQFDYGVAFRPGSDLRAPFNAYVEGLKRSGELDRLVDRQQVRGLGTPAPLAKP